MPTKMFNPLELAKATSEQDADGRSGYDVQADELYAAVLDAIESGAMPSPGDDADVAHFSGLLAGVRQNPQAIADARVPLDELALLPLDQFQARRQNRANVLEVARLWFTSELSRALNRQPLLFGIRTAVQPSPWRL